MVGFVVGGLALAGAALGAGAALATDTGAGRRGAEVAAQESREAERRARETLSPFIDAGTGALGGLTEGSTIEGLDARLGRIFDSQIFGNLVEERTRGVEGALSAGGLTRSGTAIEELARVPGDLGLQIEQLLTGRLGGLSSQGLQAGGALSGIQLQGGQFRGEGFAQGITGDAATKNKAIQGIFEGAAKGASFGAGFV